MALQRSLGWKIVQREFADRWQSAIGLAMNPDTPLEETQRIRQTQAGINEVLNFPKRQIDMHAPVEEVVRAGVHGSPEEE